MTTKTLRISVEFEEGRAAYADGIDGYAATPYPDCTQEMTDWFAGWIAAKNEDQRDFIYALTALDAQERQEMRRAVGNQNNYLRVTGQLI